MQFGKLGDHPAIATRCLRLPGRVRERPEVEQRNRRDAEAVGAMVVVNDGLHIEPAAWRFST
jgi:hypothetical protein